MELASDRQVIRIREHSHGVVVVVVVVTPDQPSDKPKGRGDPGDRRGQTVWIG